MSNYFLTGQLQLPFICRWIVCSSLCCNTEHCVEKEKKENTENEAFIILIKSDVCACLLVRACKCAREQIEVSQSI